MPQLALPLLAWFVASVALSVLWLLLESRSLARTPSAPTGPLRVPSPRAAQDGQRVPALR